MSMTPELARLLDAQKRLAELQESLSEAEDHARSVRLQVRAAQEDVQRSMVAVNAAVQRATDPTMTPEPPQAPPPPPEPAAPELTAGPSPEREISAAEGHRMVAAFLARPRPKSRRGHRKILWRPGEPLPPNMAEVLQAIPVDGSIRFGELRERVGLPDHVVRSRIGRLKQCGLMESVSWGVYGVTNLARDTLKLRLVADGD